MATLVNKVNPAIRMTAPEIEVHEEEEMYFIPVGNYCIPMCIDDWELVEEEPVKEEICSKCVHHKDDGYCYYPHGGMQRRINENGVYECTGFCEREQEESKRKQSPALKKIMDNLSEEKLDKTRAEMKIVEEEPEKESVEHIRKDLVVDAIKLAYGKVSMNPFDCSEAFEELLDKVGYEIH